DRGDGLSVPYRDEGVALVASAHRLLEDRAHPADIELVIDDARLERSPLPRQQGGRRGGPRCVYVRGEAEDAKVILRVALVELLQAVLPAPGMAWHEDPGVRSVDTAAPAALGAS